MAKYKAPKPPAGITQVTAPAAGTDATSQLQTALTNQKKILLGDGLFQCHEQIYLTGGEEIYLSDNTVIEKTFNATGATSSAFFRNKDLHVRISDIKIVGKGDIRAADKMEGNLFSINADRFMAWNFRTTNWLGGRHTMMQGNDNYYNKIDWVCDKEASTGAGGMRFSGGLNFLMENSHIVSGDDAFQFVPAGAFNDPFFNGPDIVNGVYRRCTGQSYSGRLCVVGLQDELDNGKLNGMTSGVHGVRFAHISGFGGKSGYVHQNKSSSGSITGVRTLDVVIDQKFATAGQRGEIYLNGVPATGGIDDVDLSGVTILNPRPYKSYYAQDGKVTNVVPPPGLTKATSIVYF